MTKVKYIERISLGKYEIQTWYWSPYPEPYGKLPYLYICEHCCKYWRYERNYEQHLVSLWSRIQGVQIVGYQFLFLVTCRQ